MPMMAFSVEPYESVSVGEARTASSLKLRPSHSKLVKEPFLGATRSAPPPRRPTHKRKQATQAVGPVDIFKQ
eukprot:5738408-Pleurochrysis_carterae.AAC.1